MDQPLKQRLIGAAVLVALAVIFLPMLLTGPDVREAEADAVPLSMPPTPGQEFETRELPLTVPEPAPAGGVLGMSGAAPAVPAPAASVAGSVPADAVADLGPPDTEGGDAAVATDSPAAGPAPVGAAGGDYVVAVGSFADVANARALAGKLRAAGLPVRADAVPIGAAQGLRLRVGPYADRAAAEAARLRAQAATNVSGKVVALDGAPLPPPASPAPVAKPAVPATAVAKLPAPASSSSVTLPAKSATPLANAPPAPTSNVSPAAAPGPAAEVPASSGGAPATVTAGFAVQLSAPSVEADAIGLRDKARAAGFPSFVQRIEVDGGVRWRVRVGPFADRASADAARGAANGKLGTKGIVMRHP